MTPATRWDRRDKKRHKARHGMRVSGRSVKTLAEVQAKKTRKNKHEWGVIGSAPGGDVEHCPLCNQYRVGGDKETVSKKPPEGLVLL